MATIIRHKSEIEPHTNTLNADGGNEHLLHNNASCSETLKAELLKRVDQAEERKLHPINFDGIIGHQPLKNAILYAVSAKLISSDRSKQLMKSIDHHSVKAILIYGLPGLGKSDILRAVGESVKDNPDIDCKYMSCSDFQGQAGKNAAQIDAVFDEARKTPKKICIMLIDEIDSVMRKKRGLLNDAERTNAMQSNMDGVKDSSKIIIIATTNRVNGMEKASISRFKRIDLELPSLEERKQMIEKFILPIPMEAPLNIELMAKYTDGFSGRNFRDMCLDLNEIVEVTKKPICMEILTQTICSCMRAMHRNTQPEVNDEETNSLNSTMHSINNNTVNKERAKSNLDSETCSSRSMNDIMNPNKLAVN